MHHVKSAVNHVTGFIDNVNEFSETMCWSLTLPKSSQERMVKRVAVWVIRSKKKKKVLREQWNIYKLTDLSDDSWHLKILHAWTSWASSENYCDEASPHQSKKCLFVFNYETFRRAAGYLALVWIETLMFIF